MNNKETILKATLELASEIGLGNVSLSKIATKVGIQKTSLYSHFSSKEEIIDCLYVYLRETAKQRNAVDVLNLEAIANGQDAYEILHHAVMNYMKITNDADMKMFYRFIMSERVFRADAASVMIAETEKMIFFTKQLFYAMQVHKLLCFPDVDMTAISFAMTIHSLMDYQYDKLFVEDVDMHTMIEQYLTYFCTLYHVKENI